MYMCIYNMYVYMHIYVCMYMYMPLGGSSTKLSFQSLNRDDVNSVHHVMPMGMYEGIGEEYNHPTSCVQANIRSVAMQCMRVSS